jgi:hypothetical protein
MWFAVTSYSRQWPGVLYGYSDLREGLELGTPGPKLVVLQA